jgi:hypothetical protein
MTTPDDHQPHRHRVSWSNRECIICGSRAVGMNFGAPTCAPCKGMKLFTKSHTYFIYFKKLSSVAMLDEKK